MSLVRGLLNRLWVTYIVECYTAIKNNEAALCKLTWNDTGLKEKGAEQCVHYSMFNLSSIFLNLYKIVINI